VLILRRAYSLRDGRVEASARNEARSMTTRHRKEKEDPFHQYLWYYLEILEWHVFYGGPRFERREFPYHDWKTDTEKIGYEDELEHEEWLSLDLIVKPYRQRLVVSRREITRLDFKITSSSEAHGGLFETRRDGSLHGWVHFPFAGVQALLAVLASGRPVVLQINGSAFKCGTALIRSTSQWVAADHPDLEAEFA
jgi:hypothetical protein